MKTLLILGFVILLFLFFRSFLRGSANASSVLGSFDDIKDNIEKLMQSTKDDSFLIITVHGTEDFVQFTADEKGVQLDLPLITERQKTFENRFKEICLKSNLKPIVHTGSDGSRFLDVDIEGTPTDIAKTIQAIIEDLYSVDQCGKLEFVSNT